MPSNLHEDLVDEIRFNFSEFCQNYWPLHPLYEKYQNASPESEEYKTSSLLPYPMVIAAEHWLAAMIWPELSECGCHADSYFSLVDGFGYIVVEVGKMKDGKWNWLKHPDDHKPVRVLRVGFDASIWLLNPRETKPEIAMMKFYREKLANYEH